MSPRSIFKADWLSTISTARTLPAAGFRKGICVFGHWARRRPDRSGKLSRRLMLASGQVLAYTTRRYGNVRSYIADEFFSKLLEKPPQASIFFHERMFF
jgi:hypothetical protein